MKIILKRKLIVSLITVFNIGFILLLMDSNEIIGQNSNILSEVLDFIFMLLVFSFIYIAPFIIFIGVPFSILFEKILDNVKHGDIVSFVLHIFTNILLGLFVISLLGIGDQILDVSNLLNQLLLMVYPAVSFCIIDFIIKRAYVSKKR